MSEMSKGGIAASNLSPWMIGRRIGVTTTDGAYVEDVLTGIYIRTSPTASIPVIEVRLKVMEYGVRIANDSMVRLAADE